MDPQAVIACTRRWIADIVIGLDLCPFARRVFEGERIRYVATDAPGAKALLEQLRAELAILASSAEAVETTLLIHPLAFRDFLRFNDFLADCDALIGELALDGVIQVVGFHPEYQFAGTHVDSAANYTNRSPYPMLHLLREASITRAASDGEHLLDEIPRRNIATLTEIGTLALRARLAAIRDADKGNRAGP